MTKRKKKLSRRARFWRDTLLILLCILAVFIVIGFIPGLTVTKYNYISGNLPASFDGFKILQISDFHCKEFGKNEEKLLAKIYEQDPDIIVLTGDMIDGYHNSIDNASALVNELAKKYPIYQVDGNHDSDNYTLNIQLEKLYSANNVINLNGHSATIEHNDGAITLSGIPYLNENRVTTAQLEAELSKAPPGDNIDILLSHNPLLFPSIYEYGYELILSGHIHGGIVRLPFIGGLINTNAGFGTRYEAGIYQSGLSTMIVSRGLGDIQLPLPRFYNKAELVLITLKCN